MASEIKKASDIIARALALKAEKTAKSAIIAGEKTASGSVATFDDAVSGLPYKNIAFNIDAQQSGSGDPSPRDPKNVRQFVGFTAVKLKQSGSDTSDPTVTTVALPDSAGTVYVGSVDFATGKLIITHACKTVSELAAISNWSKYEWNGHWFFYHAGSPTMKNNTPPLSSHYKQGGSPGDYQQMLSDKTCGYIFTTSIAVRDEAFENSASGIADFVATMGDVQFLYELASPIEKDIDPVTLNALAGVNNVWVGGDDIDNIGDIAVTYYGFITDRLVASIKAGDAVVTPTDGAADITDAVNALIDAKLAALGGE